MLARCCAEGINAGMWTVGVCLSGNGSPFTKPEELAVEWDVREHMCAKRWPFDRAGAHYVIPSVANLPAVLDDIQSRMDNGEVPVPATKRSS